MKHFSHLSVKHSFQRAGNRGLSGRGTGTTVGGSALIIVLVMVVLLTILMLAYLLNSAADRRLSNSSLNQTIADQLARSASDIIIGDLKQEIANGSYSTINTVGPSGATSTISMPNLSSANNYSGMMPMTNTAATTGTSYPIPNLVRISVRSDPIAAPGVNSRASAASSLTSSLNNRYVSNKRWNAHFLLPLATSTSGTTVPDCTPVSTFPVPDWVYVTNEEGPTVEPANSPNQDSNGKAVTTIGRYAYAIYDEGGLLDVNVAGQPVPVDPTPGLLTSTGSLTAAQASNKSSLALIDLTNLLDVGGNPLITAAAENALVGWRNYASAQWNFQTSITDTTTISGQFPAGFSFSSNNANDFFYNFGRGSSYAYLKSNNIATGANNLTDQQFVSRQQLITMQSSLQSLGFSPLALQYLTTFSRSLDQPSYAPNSSRPRTATYSSGTDPATVSLANPNGTVPATVYANTAAGNDDLINPSFLTVRVGTTVTGGRNDGSDLTAGDPLVKKRFALNRLAWITYEGPLSDGSNVGTATSAAQVNGGNNDLQKIAGYLHDYYGLSYAFLSKGTAANIYSYFGLSWVTDTRTYGNSLYGTVSQKKWFYNHSNTNAAGPFTSLPANGSSSFGPILRVGRPLSVTAPDSTRYVQDLATPREPDFFELLKASIVAGSKGRTATLQVPFLDVDGKDTRTKATDPNDFQNKLDSSLEFQTIQIGANIIEQSRLDGYPVQILYNDGSIAAVKEFAGTENLPYFYGVRTGAIQGAAPKLNSMPMPQSKGYYQFQPVTPTTLPTLTNSGYNVVLAFPIIWNPHDQNCPRCATFPASGEPLVDASNNALFPTSFRIVADSIDPDEITTTPTGSYGTFQLSAGAALSTGINSTGTLTVGKVSLVNTDTQAGSATFVTGAPFTSQSQWVNTNNPFYLSAESTALNFYINEDPNSTAASAALTAQYFFREPTLLISPNVPFGSFLGAGGSKNCLNPNISSTSNYPPTSTFPSLQLGAYMDTTGSATFFTTSFGGSGALYTTDNANVGNTTTTNNRSLNLRPMLGFYLGVVPGAYYWDQVTPKENYQASVSGTIVADLKLPCPLTPSITSVPITYRMQYQAPSAAGGGWMTYDAKYATSIDNSPPITQTDYNNWTFVSGTSLSNRVYCQGYDPRTSRFSMPFNVMNGPGASPPGVFSANGSEPVSYSVTGTFGSTVSKPGQGWAIISSAANGSKASTATFGWLGGANASGIQDINSRVSTPTGTVVKSNEIMTMRPDVALGFYSAWETTGNSTVDTQFPLAQGWMLNNYTHAVYPGLLEINNANYTPSGTYSQTVTCQSGTFVPNSPGGSTIDSSFLPNANGTLSQYYADCDGVVRRAAGAYFTDTSGTISTTAAPGVYPGLTLATAYTVQNASGNNVAQQQVQSRPIILHRPFRSVAELGYVFSGTPFKNLDFFTPESGDCPLLDVFCIDDSDRTDGLVAGKVNLNTRQIPVLQALIAGAYKDEEKNYQGNYQPSNKITMLPAISGATWNTEGFNIANLLHSRTSGTGGTGPAWGPLEFVSDLVGRYVGPQGGYVGTKNLNSSQPYDGFSSDLNASSAFAWSGDSAVLENSNAQIQRFREAPIRALSAVGQTRVWNLMIDVIAQKGKFPSNASNLDNFYVAGEQRYWVHVAIDRFTGQVIDKQIEVVEQ